MAGEVFDAFKNFRFSALDAGVDLSKSQGTDLLGEQW